MILILILIIVLALSATIMLAIKYVFDNKNLSVYATKINSVQDFHKDPVPRIGGIAIIISSSVGLFLLDEQTELLSKLLLCSLPIFIIGFYEDLTKKVTPIARLRLIFFSIACIFFWQDVGILSLGFEVADYFLSYTFISLLVTLLVVGGAVNSFNIIDGFNGLLGGYSILASLAISYVAYMLGDNLILQLNLILSSSILGFIAFNYPFGKVFMGDAGAYFIGFMLAIIGLIFVDRHEVLSNWFVLLIFMYPMYELLYSIYRRKIVHKVDATQPDDMHLHTLVYKKLISYDRFNHNHNLVNSMTSPFMWLLSLVSIFPAIIWYSDQTMLIISAVVFMVIYTTIYNYILSRII